MEVVSLSYNIRETREKHLKELPDVLKDGLAKLGYVFYPMKGIDNILFWAKDVSNFDSIILAVIIHKREVEKHNATWDAANEEYNLLEYTPLPALTKEELKLFDIIDYDLSPAQKRSSHQNITDWVINDEI